MHARTCTDMCQRVSFLCFVASSSSAALQQLHTAPRATAALISACGSVVPKIVRRRSASVESENQFVFGQTGPSPSGESDSTQDGDALPRAKQRRDGKASRRSFQRASRPLNAKAGYSVPTEYFEGQQANLAGSDYLTAEAQHCKINLSTRSQSPQSII